MYKISPSNKQTNQPTYLEQPTQPQKEKAQVAIILKPPNNEEEDD
jgi:hypothetical protein